MFLSLKIVYGIVKHDVLAYMESFRIAREWAKAYPEIDPRDFSALEQRAWEDLNVAFQKQAGEVSLFSQPRDEEMN